MLASYLATWDCLLSACMLHRVPKFHTDLQQGNWVGVRTERWESPRKQLERPLAWLMRLLLARPSSDVVRAICRCHPGPHASM